MVVSPKEGIDYPGALFRLGAESTERTDVSAQFPDKKKKLIETYGRLTAGLPKPVQHSTKPDPDQD